MFSDDEIKENHLMQPGDEIISVQEVCLIDKFDKKDLDYSSGSLALLPTTTSRSDADIDVPRFLRDGFFLEDQQQAKFAWTEEDGNIAEMVSEPGFGTTGHTTFGKDLDAALSSEIKNEDSSGLIYSRSNGLIFAKKTNVDSKQVTSTPSTSSDRSKGKGACKVDKTDPRSRFHYVKYVKRHGRTIKLWECGICGREFQHQYTLMRHLPTHTDERNFHCDVCGKSFRQLSTLSQHRAIHSAARPYACEVCDKTFNRVSTLISHRKTHSTDKPYKCHVCPKAFHQKGNLRNHLFTHTNERPYRCEICEKGFNQQSNLVCHKNKAHPEDNSTGVTKMRNPSSTVPRINVRSSSYLLAESRRPPLSPSHSKVSSTDDAYTPPAQTTTLSLTKSSWEQLKQPDISKESWNETWGAGVIVDPIKTYHMGVALATKQTPFALLKSDGGAPVLVKVVDTVLPGGKQMLVPATAEDLKCGGKIILNSENESLSQQIDVEARTELGAVQIRVPVVATVVPKIREGGRLQLTVEEPHHAYHPALSSDGDRGASGKQCLNITQQNADASSSALNCLSSLRQELPHYEEHASSSGGGRQISSTCTLPPPAPSPPLDISLDLFEPMECMPMGPQITTVGNIDTSPASDDSDIYIRKFEENIAQSDSE